MSGGPHTDRGDRENQGGREELLPGAAGAPCLSFPTPLRGLGGIPAALPSPLAKVSARHRSFQGTTNSSEEKSARGGR